MIEWKPNPKPEPKEKKKYGYEYWNGVRKKSMQKMMKKKREDGTFEKDEKFYAWLWKNREHYCQNCAKKIHEFDRDIFHHILPKAKYPYFRHDERNIVILCGKFNCHYKAESAISYPKMAIYEFCEKRKAELLESVGLTYHSPQEK